jgi:hypothetical protein
VAEQAADALLRDVLRRILLARQSTAVSDQIRIMLIEDEVEIDVSRRCRDSSVHVARCLETVRDGATVAH